MAIKITKEFSLGILFGILSGIIGNFFVTSAYRIVDYSKSESALSIDLIVFLGSAITLGIVIYFFYRFVTKK